MTEFTSIDTLDLNITGRGRVTLHVVPPIDGTNPRTFLHQTVLLDGKEVRVVGVETYGVLNPAAHNFAIEVQPV